MATKVGVGGNYRLTIATAASKEVPWLHFCVSPLLTSFVRSDLQVVQLFLC